MNIFSINTSITSVNISKRINSTDDEHFCGYLLSWSSVGQFGNQLFHYASFYGIAKRTKKTAIFRRLHNAYLLETAFDNLSLFRRRSFDESSLKNLISDNECCGFAIYDHSTNDRLSCDGKNIIIVGFRQSYKYFLNVRDEIKREFQFKTSIIEKSRRLFNDSLTNRHLDRNNCVVVGVHIRTYEGNQGAYYSTEFDYLKKAIRYFENLTYSTEENIERCLIFYVIGDNYEWNINSISRIELQRPNETHFILIDHRKSDPTVDMYTTTLCDHMIITVGSFSWWCGFFNKGLVTRQMIYAEPNSWLWNQTKPNDYFLSHWIAL